MKNYLIYIGFFFISLLISSCDEEPIGQYPVDSIAPPPVTNVIVENLPGSVHLTYDLPNAGDLLYIKAVHPLPGGRTGEVKASAFSNSMLVRGFGKSKKQTIQLISVDRSQNESDPALVEIEPLDSPIFEIMEGLEMKASFGGLKILWTNSNAEEISVEVLMKNNITGEFEVIDVLYSSAVAAERSVRGLEAEPGTFGITVSDIFGNHTDTLTANLTPLFEEEIPKSGFAGLPLYSGFVVHGYGGGFSDMWDGVTNISDNLFYIRTGNTIQPFFTFDMGVTAKLSRFRHWGRDSHLYRLHSPRKFEWWGTNDTDVAHEANDLDWKENPAWIKLGTFTSYRPSGLRSGSMPTSEDVAYMRAGEEFEFPVDTPPFRYLRFNQISTWSGSTGTWFGELEFHGQIQD